MNSILKSAAMAAALALLVCAPACSKAKPDGKSRNTFLLTCTLCDGIKGDNAKLYLYYPDYGNLCLLDSTSSDRGVFSFSGSLEKPQVAMLTFGGSEIAMKFVLQPGDIGLRIYKHRIVFVGGEQNMAYADFLNKRNNAMHSHIDLWQKYAAAVADSTLTMKTDKAMASQDSTLQDSIQNMIVRGINKNEAYSLIIKDRYLNDLDSAHLSRLTATTAKRP